MDTDDTLQRPVFSHPVRQAFSMLLVLALVGVGTFFALPRVLPVFAANPYLNGFILLVWVIGVLSCFMQVWVLVKSVRWIEGFVGYVDSPEQHHAPSLLAPLATLLGQRRGATQLSPTSSRSILDSVGTRIEEDREITRYIVNTLIFLGLLGTFYGLATTVPALVDTIRSLAPRDGEQGLDVFNRLISGLENQLAGMGVAFASSLLGLAGSLVVGLLELFAGRGQNRFYRELEEWLSSMTHLGLASGDDASDREVIEALFGKMTEQVGALNGLIRSSDRARIEMDAHLQEVATAISGLANRMDSGENAAALQELAASQAALAQQLAGSGMEFGLDAESQQRLRSMDVQLLRLTEEMAAGRQELLADLRTELARLTQALGAR